MCFIALTVLVLQTAMVNLENLLILAIMVGVSFLIELLYRTITKREIKAYFG